MFRLCAILAAGWVGTLSPLAFAQPLASALPTLPPIPPLTPSPQPPDTGPPPNPDTTTTPPRDPVERLSLRGSSLGYIDPAAPADYVSFRGDMGYHFLFPNRAEMFYAQARPHGPGLPLPESSIDFQDLTLHVEKTFGQRMSAFIEGGARLLNPEINADTAGLSDSAVGLKYAFLSGADRLATFQFRTYIPTGNPNLGLGTSHVSLEPAVLGFARLGDRLGLGGELRYWIPVSGTDFAGSVMRYGLGLRWDAWDGGGVRVAPTAEFVGWTVLGGKQSTVLPGGDVLLQDAAGQTIVNAKIGSRIDIGDRLGLYLGYGRALTGSTWYRDAIRLEARWMY
jgi:hypothetical protein